MDAYFLTDMWLGEVSSIALFCTSVAFILQLSAKRTMRLLMQEEKSFFHSREWGKSLHACAENSCYGCEVIKYSYFATYFLYLDFSIVMHTNFFFYRSLQEFGQWAMERLGSSLMNSLEVGAFFLQFLEWFYSSNVTPRSILIQPIPQPPQVPLLSCVLWKKHIGIERFNSNSIYLWHSMSPMPITQCVLKVEEPLY